MANIDSQLLFITTSPRSPEKMFPEIKLLVDHFEGDVWNHESQTAFMERLRAADFFNGKGDNDPAFSARDRINRAPKSLGFVTLSPCIHITQAGKALLKAKNIHEVFLRQLLKFQIPSPYHKPTARAADFAVKPYLEVLRLIRHFGTIKFDELRIYGLQLTDYHNFNLIVKKIEHFRNSLLKNKGSYKKFRDECLKKELKSIYSERIAHGDTKTRESEDKSLDNFLRTQSSNTRDYTDALVRYLRFTGVVNVSHVGRSLSIVPERIDDVDFILNTVDRDPCFIDNENRYSSYLGDATLPKLRNDDKQMLLETIRKEFPHVKADESLDLLSLKDLYYTSIEDRKKSNISRQISEIKDYKFYDDIQNTFKQIISDKDLYDAPLMLEWNTWRAMSMLDGGDIKANLNFDDFGKPLSTASGNMADIVCDYGDFNVIVEVTMASGQKQYEMESEPVSRHLGKIKTSSGKPSFCLFIAPTINEASIAHFYGLSHVSISYYGGKSNIIPLPLGIFQKMVEDSYKADYVPSLNHVRELFEKSEVIAEKSIDERDWYQQILNVATDWLP